MRWINFNMLEGGREKRNGQGPPMSNVSTTAPGPENGSTDELPRFKRLSNDGSFTVHGTGIR